MNPKVRKWIEPLGYAALFFFSFIFFVYLTFPYTVLKEALAAKVGKAAGLDIRINEFGPALPLGFEASDVRIAATAGGKAMELKNAEVKLSILNLLIGRLGINAELETDNGGTLDLQARMGLFGLIFDNNFIPSSIELEAEKFQIESIVAFLLSRQASAPGANPMFTGLLTQIGLDGKLEGIIDLDIDTSNIAQSSGKIDLKLQDSKLRISDPSLNVADQDFKKALIQAELVNGALKIAKASGFHTQELLLDLAGDINFKNQLDRSTMNLDISLKLDQGLKEQFGFLVDMAGGSGGNGKYQLKGTLGSPSFVTL